MHADADTSSSFHQNTLLAKQFLGMSCRIDMHSIRLGVAAMVLGLGFNAGAATIARIEVVAGDRQIVVNSLVTTQPYVIRAFDADGLPLAGEYVLIGPPRDPGAMFFRDEFDFFGFNTANEVFSFTSLGFPSPAYLKITDKDGFASAIGPYIDGPFASASAPIGATQYRGGAPLAIFSTVLATKTPPGNPSVVVEYFLPEMHHYFITLNAEEVSALDAGKFAGWQRSVGAFIGYKTGGDAPTGAVPVCRFFSPVFTSHFYTADQEECEVVTQRWSSDWILETREAFYMLVPDKLDGTCPIGYRGVHRLFNNATKPNHRYVTDRLLRDRMVLNGWISEGIGVDAVVMCSPA